MTPSPVSIAVLGDHDPALRTHRELDAALAALPAHVAAEWVATDSPAAASVLDDHALAGAGPHPLVLALIEAAGR